MFWYKMRDTCISSNWGTITNSFDCFAWKVNTFRMFWPEITYFSNVLCTNTIHIECFILKFYILFECLESDVSKIFSLQNTILSNVSHRNVIFLESFGPK